jgi:purine nucleosidase
MEKKLVYLDTDISLGTPGAEIDDGAALIALLHSPHSKLMGIGSVHGNVPVNVATQNLIRLLSLLGRNDLPVGVGAAQPLLENKKWFTEWQAGYGPTPLWEIDRHLPTAANLLIDLARASERKICLLAIGPLTNLALALRLAPDIIKKIERVVAMGGSFGVPKPEAEFNIRCDPEAAQMVFSSGLPLRLLGLEITKQIVFFRDDFSSLPDSNLAVRLLKQQATGWIDRVEQAGWERGGCALHDAVAVAALLNEEFFQFREMGVSVELSKGIQRGITRFDEQKENMENKKTEVAVRVDASRCKAWILSALRT